MQRFSFGILLVGLLFLASCAATGPGAPVQQGKNAASGPQGLATPGQYSQDAAGEGPYAEGGLAYQDRQGANTPPVKVALLLPLSGPSQNIGQSLLKASQLALFDLGSETFQLLPKDTQGNAAGATLAAREAVDEGAQLILGPLFSDSVAAVKPIAQRANLNVIAFSTDWAKAGGNVYLMGFMPFIQVERVTNYTAQQGYKRVVLITKTDAYGNAVERTLMNSAGQNNMSVAKVIRVSALGITPSDLQTIQSASPDAIFMALGGREAADTARRLSQAGMSPLALKRLGTGLWDDPALAREPSLDNSWFAAPAPEQRRAFEKNYQDLYGMEPPRLATLAYDATALAAVLGKMGQTAENGIYYPAYTDQYLRNPNGFSGIDGVFRFNRNGLVERQLSVLEFRNGTIVKIDPAATRF